MNPCWPSAPKLSWRATAGVTPSVATVGRSGCCPTTGCTDPSDRAGIDRASGRTGRESTITRAGTDVAAARLTKLFTVTVLLMAAGSLTWPVLMRRSYSRDA